jgi:hypothetical protein
MSQGIADVLVPEILRIGGGAVVVPVSSLARRYAEHDSDPDA